MSSGSPNRISTAAGSSTPSPSGLSGVSLARSGDVSSETVAESSHDLCLYTAVFRPSEEPRDSEYEQGVGYCLIDGDTVVAVAGWPAQEAGNLSTSAPSVAVMRGLERVTALYPHQHITLVRRTTPSCTPEVFPDLEQICDQWTPAFREKVFSGGVDFRCGLSKVDKAGLHLAERLGWAGQVRPIDGVLSRGASSGFADEAEVRNPVRLYTDASVTPNHAGFGYVILDAKNRVVDLQARLSEESDTNRAEFNGMLHGVEAVVDHPEINDAFLVTDNRTVQRAVAGEAMATNANYRYYQSRIAGALEKLDDWVIRHKSRRFNRLADALATCARTRSLW